MKPLLQTGDPSPFEILNPHGSSSILLACEHAGQGIPKVLGDLGIPRAELERHIGWDIGAAALTRLLSQALDATAILQPYSRLVIDCNRPPEAVDSVPEISDGTTIPANINLDDREARVREIFEPYQAEVSKLLDSGRFQVALSIHSFTPQMNGFKRPWNIGFLYRKDQDTSQKLAAFLEDTYPDLCIGHNEPYNVTGVSDWFVPQHGEARGMPHSLIEVRNDHIASEQGQREWADRLARTFRHFIKEFSA